MTSPAAGPAFFGYDFGEHNITDRGSQMERTLTEALGFRPDFILATPHASTLKSSSRLAMRASSI